MFKKCGQLTQLVECHLDVVKVGGSSPSLPTGASVIKNSAANAGFLIYAEIFIIYVRSK